MRLQVLNQITKLDWLEEHRFCPPRRWRFDFASESIATAIEIEGGVWSGGRHTRGKGYLGDLEKYNTAAVLGWKVLRYTPQQFDALFWLPDVNAIRGQR